MGQFSWIYADTDKAMIDGKYKDSYLLIPPNFQDKYGKFITEHCYEGYGEFNGKDVYELVAEFNRDFIPKVLELAEKGEWHSIGKGTLEEIKNNNYYKELVLYYNEGNKGADEGYEFNSLARLVGISLACYDEDNVRLLYPIKITSEPYNYNAVGYSKSDPNQGWYDEEENEWY